MYFQLATAAGFQCAPIIPLRIPQLDDAVDRRGLQDRQDAGRVDSVIQMRSRRLTELDLQPIVSDLRELYLMGDENMAAASESGAAIASQLQKTQARMVRGTHHWLASAAALMALATSSTPARAMHRGEAFITATTHAAATASQLSSRATRLVQRNLQPIHAKATSNARGLSQEIQV